MEVDALFTYRESWNVYVTICVTTTLHHITLHYYLSVSNLWLRTLQQVVT